MTGPEHYSAAESLISGVEEHGEDFTPEGRAQVIALAQVHATLALAAATALSQTGPDGSYYPRDEVAWHEAAGTKDAATAGED